MTSKKIHIKEKNASIQITDTATKMFTDVLQQVAPNTARILNNVITEIYDDAYTAWPVRQIKKQSEKSIIANAANKIKKDTGFDNSRSYAIATALYRGGDLIADTVSSKSQDSKNKLYKQLIIRDTDVFANVGNSAPYAWAIKVGINTDLPYALGTRVSNELLFKPAKKQTNRIVTVLADDLANTIKKA